MMINKNVFKTQTGVKIAFSGAIKKESVIKMVENCATGQCACMSDESKEKIKDMKVSGLDGDVALDLVGTGLTTDEIEAALKRSTVINDEEI